MPHTDFAISEFPGLQFGSVYCIGRNYAKHAREMGSETPSEPVVFLKPRSSLTFNNSTVILPPQSKNVHHEVELVILIGNKTQKISSEQAHDVIKGVAIGLDLTARDLQTEAKQKGLPWSVAKGIDTFAPVGKFTEYTPSIDLRNLDIELRINNTLRQSGNTSRMIFPVADIISYLSHRFTLFPGDLIFTGTPEGVGPVKSGDSISAALQQELSTLSVHAI